MKFREKNGNYQCIDSEVWKTVAKICKFLEPFKQGTLDLSSDKIIYISQVYPVFSHLVKHL